MQTLLPVLAEQAPSVGVWAQNITSGGAGVALIYVVKKIVDGSIVWRPMAEILEKAITAIEAANERDDIYIAMIKKKLDE